MPIRLTQPTDFLILDSLSDGKRDTASNIAKRIDKQRTYINTRLPVLADYDLIEKIGPPRKLGTVSNYSLEGWLLSKSRRSTIKTKNNLMRQFVS